MFFKDIEGKHQLKTVLIKSVDTGGFRMPNFSCPGKVPVVCLLRWHLRLILCVKTGFRTIVAVHVPIAVNRINTFIRIFTIHFLLYGRETKKEKAPQVMIFYPNGVPYWIRILLWVNLIGLTLLMSITVHPISILRSALISCTNSI